jgi:hypothetical protein
MSGGETGVRRKEQQKPRSGGKPATESEKSAEQNQAWVKDYATKVSQILNKHAWSENDE